MRNELRGFCAADVLNCYYLSTCHARTHRLAEEQSTLRQVQEECRTLQQAIDDQQTTVKVLREEHQSLQAEFMKGEDRLRKLAIENKQLLDRLQLIKSDGGPDTASDPVEQLDAAEKRKASLIAAAMKTVTGVVGQKKYMLDEGLAATGIACVVPSNAVRNMVRDPEHNNNIAAPSPLSLFLLLLTILPTACT